MDNVFRKTIRSLCKFGLLTTFQKMVISSRNRIRTWVFFLVPNKRGREFDIKFGLDTQDWVARDDQTIDPPIREHSNAYEATPVSVMQSILEKLSDGHEDFSFVDLGCGKGRTLLLASHFPFQEVVGIELDSDLVEIARANIDRYRSTAVPNLACSAITLLHQNAAEYVFPERDFVLYLYNPFDHLVMSQVIANMERDLNRVPVRVIVIYANPLHANLFDESKHFMLAEVIDREIVKYRIYRNY